MHVAERVAGIASCAYASAFSQAVERALGVTPPPRAQSWRALYCELERMACHLDVIAKEAETTALYVGQARFQILKERVQRLRAQLTGSRFGRGVILPGGVRVDGMIDLDQVCEALDELERDLARDRALFLGTASMTDRLIGGGHLPRELVERYGAVGPVARGSGVSTDARHERPYGDYRPARDPGRRAPRRRRDGPDQRPLRRTVGVAADLPPGDRTSPPPRRRAARRAARRRDRRGVRLGRGPAGRAAVLGRD